MCFQLSLLFLISFKSVAIAQYGGNGAASYGNGYNQQQPGYGAATGAGYGIVESTPDIIGGFRGDGNALLKKCLQWLIQTMRWWKPL
jgi:hypothetical protein